MRHRRVGMRHITIPRLARMAGLELQPQPGLARTHTDISRSCASAKHNENDVSLIRFRRRVCESVCECVWLCVYHYHCCVLWEKFRRLKMFRWQTSAPHAPGEQSNARGKIEGKPKKSEGKPPLASKPKCDVCMHIEFIPFVFCFSHRNSWYGNVGNKKIGQ